MHNRDKREYEVLQDEKEHKQSYLLIALKIASYSTLILPVIMGLGKLITRSYYTFYDRSTPLSSTDQAAVKKKINRNGKDTFAKDGPITEDNHDMTANYVVKPVVKLKEAKEAMEAMLGFKIPNEIEKTAPMEFISNVLFSGEYSEKEIEVLKKHFIWTYCAITRGKVVGFESPNSWTSESITTSYLQSLANRHPSFGAYKRQVLSCESWHVNMKNNGSSSSSEFMFLPLGLVTPEVYHSIESKRIADNLPELSQAKQLYGFALAVNNNTHRTAFIIDTQRCRVEYYNSFGSDANAKGLLTAVAKALSEKYGKSFTYHHQTASSHLQKDGYQCGIWACKFIEERIIKGGPYDGGSLQQEANKIAFYRQHVFREALKEGFFEDIAKERIQPFFPDVDPIDFRIWTWGERQVKAWSKGTLPVDEPYSQLDQFTRYLKEKSHLHSQLNNPNDPKRREGIKHLIKEGALRVLDYEKKSFFERIIALGDKELYDLCLLHGGEALLKEMGIAPQTPKQLKS